MIITRWIGVRLAALIVFGCLFQLTFLSKIIVFEVAPDMLPALAVALGLLGGAVVGAGCGFAIGILADSALIAPLGITSLALLSAGYLAGRFREAFEIAGARVPVVLAGVLTAVSATIVTAIQLTLGARSDVSPLIVREIVLQALMAPLLMAALFPIVRRILRDALIDLEAPKRPEARPLGSARTALR